MSVEVSRTIDLIHGHATCVVCGKDAAGHGDFTIGRRHGEDELVEILFPVCPSCLYGDTDPIDRADRRILFERGLAAVLPSRRESM